MRDFKSRSFVMEDGRIEKLYKYSDLVLRIIYITIVFLFIELGIYFFWE